MKNHIIRGGAIKTFLLALQFLTVITVIPSLTADRDQLSATLAFFPLIGLLLGGMVAFAAWLSSGLWPAMLSGASAVVFLALLTRGLHLDGLADTFDAIGSGAEREKALLIMKDSCSGALGVLAMVSVFMLKVASAVSLVETGGWYFIALAPCLSRWSMHCLAACSEYARPGGGLGSAFCGSAARRQLVAPGVTALAASWFMAGAWGVLLFLAGTVAGPVASLYFRGKFGGITGDMLGAHVETVETFLMMAGASICS